MKTLAIRKSRAGRQRGQAAVEAIIVLAMFVILSAGVAALGDLQWRGLDAAHASRHQAFLQARGALAGRPASRYAGALADRTADHARDGIAGLPGRLARNGRSPAFMGPGGAAAAALRREWGAEDPGMVTAVSQFRSSIEPAWVAGSRHTSVLSGAAHASDDEDAHRIVGASRTSWTQAAHPSIQAGRPVAATLHRIDSGWGRARPRFDWLSPWSDLAPAERLQAPRADAGRSGR